MSTYALSDSSIVALLVVSETILDTPPEAIDGVPAALVADLKADLRAAVATLKAMREENE